MKFLITSYVLWLFKISIYFIVYLQKYFPWLNFHKKDFFHCVMLDQALAKHHKINPYPRFLSITRQIPIEYLSFFILLYRTNKHIFCYAYLLVQKRASRIFVCYFKLFVICQFCEFYVLK